jgi:hypothetical protein
MRRTRLARGFADCRKVAVCYDDFDLSALIKLGETMKNPLDSLGQTVLCGFILTVIVILLIRAISA